jgi:hypothetical protein
MYIILNVEVEVCLKAPEIASIWPQMGPMRAPNETHLGSGPPFGPNMVPKWVPIWAPSEFHLGSKWLPISAPNGNPNGSHLGHQIKPNLWGWRHTPNVEAISKHEQIIYTNILSIQEIPVTGVETNM